MRALVTGTSRGLGAAILDAANARGHEVISLGRTPPRSSERAFVHCDLSIPMSTKTKNILQSRMSDGIDALVLNAAERTTGTLKGLGPNYLRDSFEVAVVSSLELLNTCRPYLQARNGTVIFIGSTSAELASPGTAAYSIAKAGEKALAETTQLELRGSGVFALYVRLSAISNRVSDTSQHKLKPPDVACALWQIIESGAVKLGLFGVEFRVLSSPIEWSTPFASLQYV